MNEQGVNHSCKFTKYTCKYGIIWTKSPVSICQLANYLNVFVLSISKVRERSYNWDISSKATLGKTHNMFTMSKFNVLISMCECLNWL